MVAGCSPQWGANRESAAWVGPSPTCECPLLATSAHRSWVEETSAQRRSPPDRWQVQCSRPLRWTASRVTFFFIFFVHAHEGVEQRGRHVDGIWENQQNAIADNPICMIRSIHIKTYYVHIYLALKLKNLRTNLFLCQDSDLLWLKYLNALVLYDHVSFFGPNWRASANSWSNG